VVALAGPAAPANVVTLTSTLPIYGGSLDNVGACGVSNNPADISYIEIHGQPQWCYWLGAPLVRDTLLQTAWISPPGSLDGRDWSYTFTLPPGYWSVWVRAGNSAGTAVCESPMVGADTAGFVQPPWR
jgi:hypothetical protein